MYLFFLRQQQLKGHCVLVSSHRGIKPVAVTQQRTTKFNKLISNGCWQCNLRGGNEAHIVRWKSTPTRSKQYVGWVYLLFILTEIWFCYFRRMRKGRKRAAVYQVDCDVINPNDVPSGYGTLSLHANVSVIPLQFGCRLGICIINHSYRLLKSIHFEMRLSASL